MAVPALRRRASGRAALAVALAVFGTALTPFGLGWSITGPSRSPAARGSFAAAPLRASEFELGEVGNAVGDGGTTPLMLAAFKNNEDEVKKYAENGADLNLQDAYGWSAVRYAARANNKEASQALIDAGADLNLPSKSGRTPLMSAASNGFSDIVEMLLKGGADKSKTDTAGQTAYDLSLRGGPTGCKKCQELLKA